MNTKQIEYAATVLRGIANEIETAAYDQTIDVEPARAMLLSARTIRTICDMMKPAEAFKPAPLATDAEKPAQGGNGSGGSKVPRKPIQPQGSPPARLPLQGVAS